MKKIIVSIVLMLCAVGLWAVPAYPGWQTKQTVDGREVNVRLVGDEWCAYWESADGKLMLEQADGTFVPSEERVPTKDVWEDRRTRARDLRGVAPALVSKGIKRAKQAVGTTPNLAPKGVVILVNFTDSEMKAAHTNDVFDNMCNAAEGQCTTNAHEGENYGSAAQYFADQSNGSYRPQFDVIGPVTLPHDVKYYGEHDLGEDGLYRTDDDGLTDMYMADFVIDAILAAEEAGCDFSQYDSDGDGYVDFVYFIYAGKGEAYGGAPETIWPHNYELISALYLGQTHGRDDYYINSQSDYNLLIMDGKVINNYACSSELDGYNKLCGIGTLCHEFGHVMGLPDFYDTQYGENEQNGLTPGAWNVMDAGCYNGNLHCPPNYDPWEKYFFGWVEPVNLGSTPSNGTLYANGTDDYNAYQVNQSGKQQTATANNQLNYYLENRQQSGWDKFLPGHGMVVWRVDYNSRVWSWNAPNNEAGNPRYTVAQVSDSWEAVEGKAVTEVEESNGVVTFEYMGGAHPIDSAWIDWQFYDDGKQAHQIGRGHKEFYWGIMIPGNTQTNNALTKVAVYEKETNNTQPITIDIYSDGETPVASNKIYTETVEPAAGDSFHIITLADTVFFEPTRNLWVILSEGTDANPAMVSANTGDANGRWVSLDGDKWEDLAEDYNLDYTFMIRAYCERLEQPQEQGLEEEPAYRFQKGRGQKFVKEGELRIQVGEQTYNIMGQIIDN
ncbi:MAG: M6 family metalloprotease domain-containing protein [Paludibacteraceae bacterium]|nr:M6 family metalloprotease domain-containing protein [Paludibacteraceae bacterium]